MSRLVALVAALGVMLTCQRAEAQSWEASAFAGYTPSVEIDRRAPDLSQLDAGGGFTWGLQAARLFTNHWGAEALWTQQKSSLQGGTPSAGTFDFFFMTIRQLQGHVLYEFGAGDAPLRPFVFGGLGATFFTATDLQSETKLSIDYGAGLNYFASSRRHSTTHQPATSAIRSAFVSPGSHKLSSQPGRSSASEPLATGFERMSWQSILTVRLVRKDADRVNETFGSLTSLTDVLTNAHSPRQGDPNARLAPRPTRRSVTAQAAFADSGDSRRIHRERTRRGPDLLPVLRRTRRHARDSDGHVSPRVDSRQLRSGGTRYCRLHRRFLFRS
jgi:hypothetical protein